MIIASGLPPVSVCLAVRNGAEHIGEQVRALAAQDYAGWFEVIVADNGSTDRTVEAIYLAAPEGLRIRVIDAGRRARANIARNAAAAGATGEFLAFCDHDDAVRPGWITALVAAARHGDVVCGVIDTERLNDPVVRTWKPDRVKDRLVIAHGMMPSIIGASCGLWADVWTAVGGFDEAIDPGHDDVELGWRTQLAGYRLVFAPDAIVDYRYRASIVGLARQTFSRYRGAARLVAAYRPLIDQRPTTSKRSDRHAARLLRTLPGAVMDRGERGAWVYTAAKGLGWVVGSLESRFGTTSTGSRAADTPAVETPAARSDPAW